MFAHLRQFRVGNEDRLLIYCIIHFLTHRSLPDTSVLKTLTTDYNKLHSFLVSDQANYLDKLQQKTIEHIVSNTGMNEELLENFTIFFENVTNEFEQK